MHRRIICILAIVFLFGIVASNQSRGEEMKTQNDNSKTLRLLFPQWQGGNNKLYTLGSRLLAWLAPESDAPLVEVPVKPFDAQELKKENGVVAQSLLLKQQKAARDILDIHEPDRVVVFGGDCLVSQVPFAYLNEKYDGELGVLWIDTHPDVSTPEFFQHEHAMVLGNLLGKGDPKFAAEVKVPIKAENVIYAGLIESGMNDEEAKEVRRLGLRCVGPKELVENSDVITSWIKEKKIKKLAIHFDLDVLDPACFRSLYFSDPQAAANAFDGIARGQMTFEQVIRLIVDVSKETDVVGLTIAEHLPWDMQNLKNMLEQLPILK